MLASQLGAELRTSNPDPVTIRVFDLLVATPAGVNLNRPKGLFLQLGGGALLSSVHTDDRATEKLLAFGRHLPLPTVRGQV